MKWILSIALSSAALVCGLLDPPPTTEKKLSSNAVESIEIFTEEGESKVLFLNSQTVEKEFLAKGGSLDSIRTIDIQTGEVSGYPLNLRKIVQENKIALLSSGGSLRAAIAWQVFKNAGYSNLWLPSGVKNGIDTITPLPQEVEDRAKNIEIEDKQFEEIKKLVAAPDREYQSIFKEKTPLFTDRHGLVYEKIPRMGEDWAAQFDPRFLVGGEINKEALLHRKILRERIDREYYIPIIQNKQVIIALSKEAYQGAMLRLIEVSIKYNLSLEGVRIVPLLVEEIESSPNQNAYLERYINALRKLIGFPPLYS